MHRGPNAMPHMLDVAQERHLVDAVRVVCFRRATRNRTRLSAWCAWLLTVVAADSGVSSVRVQTGH